MRGGDWGGPPSVHLPTTRGTKRKHSPSVEQCYSHVNRERFVSETVTSTQFSHKPQNLSGSGDFKLNQCSYKSQKWQNYKRNRREFGTAECHNRRWVFSSRDFSNCKDKFVVVSYNILGVENASNHSDMYIDVPTKYLDWEWRKNVLSKEIRTYLPSVLCFQEVDRFDDLNKLLQKDGFRGVYKARTGEACDGCAIFWKDERFTLLHQENIEFREFDLRDNVAQLCVLEMNQKKSNADVNTQILQPSPTRNVLVGNIHVLFNPKRGDIKLGQIHDPTQQVRLFLEKAHKLSQEWGNIPIVISGDLNSVPKSAMYQFLASSELDIRLHDRRKISGQVQSPSPYRTFGYQKYRTFGYQKNNLARCDMSISKPWMYRWTDEEIRLATGSNEVTHLQHPLKLCSAYFGIPGTCRTRDNFGEPLATSYHSKFMGTVDYIWHSQEFVPLRVLETLPLNILQRTGGLPNEKWGSDHLALVCELAFLDDESKT